MDAHGSSDRHAVSYHRRICTGVLALVALTVYLVAETPRASASTPSGPNPCDRAADLASREFDIPPDVLRALTRTETGRSRAGRSEPWPWTVNMEGAGAWFPDADTALAHVFASIKRGARSFDIGCFQINHKWHGAAFSSIEEMFRPEANARYAAKFLSELYREYGDWSAAAGAFHSRTPELAERYVARFDRIRRALPAGRMRPVPSPSAPPAGPRGWNMSRRTQPLIGAGLRVSRGSLVPLAEGAGGLRPLVVLTN